MKAPQQIFQSISCLDDEDLVEKAYDGLLATMDLVNFDKKKGHIELSTINGNRKRDFDVFSPIVDGIYIPGSKRDYWAGFVDPVDHPLPKNGCVYIEPRFQDVKFEFITVKKIDRLPSKIVCSCKETKHLYKTFNTYIFKDLLRKPLIEEGYFGIDERGSVYTAVDRLKLREASNYGWYLTDLLNREVQNARDYATGAISLLADRKYLWNIKTIEPITPKINAIINFGVEKDMVKSLIFARDNPLTESGRKRPILHWVQSHKRRIKNKIKVDVRKHLRGITEFKLGELSFEITNPTKIIEKESASFEDNNR